MRPLLIAGHGGERLDAFSILIHGQATLSLICALHGWPLVRSDEHWQDRFRHSEAGGPEGLAYKIGLFEQTAREDGWNVKTPGTPGLPGK
jgi:hypothetical protein